MKHNGHEPLKVAFGAPPGTGQARRLDDHDFNAIQAEADRLLEPLEGWLWAYKNISGDLVSLERLLDVCIAQSDKFGGLSFALKQVCETAGGLSVEHQEVLLFAARSLQEEKAVLETVWPAAPSVEGHTFFVHPEALDA